MRLLHHNEIDTYAALEFSSEASGFPAANVQHIHLSRRWRTTGVASEYYTIDAGAGNTITADCAAIAAHNLTSGAMIKVMAHTSNDWGAPDLSVTFTWSAGIMMAFFAPTAKRFWRFDFADAANPDGYLEIGRLGFGEYLQMPPIEPDAELPIMTTSEQLTSLSGQVYGDRRLTLLVPAFALPIVSEAQRQAIKEMFAEVHNLTPLFLVVWEDSLDVEPPLYCRINQEQLEFRKAEEAGVMWSLDLEFVEVL